MDPTKRATAQQCLLHPFLNHTGDDRDRERYFECKHDA